jgi:hypothetical protein
MAIAWMVPVSRQKLLTGKSTISAVAPSLDGFKTVGVLSPDSSEITFIYQTAHLPR